MKIVDSVRFTMAIMHFNTNFLGATNLVDYLVASWCIERKYATQVEVSVKSLLLNIICI